MSDDTLPSETHLAQLGPKFLEALAKRNAGQVDAALEAFLEILKVEPRLAEPRMEIARIFLEMGRLDDAEEEVREAIRIVESGGVWTEDVPESLVAAIAWALLGEILKEKASSDEVVFGDPEVFRNLLAQSRAAFSRAAELDPNDTVSLLNAAELGDAPEAEPEAGLDN